MKKFILFFCLTLIFANVAEAQTDVINIIPGGNVGISSTAPVSSLEVSGSYGQKVTTITANTTIDATHNTVVCNNGATAITVTLPTASTATGRVYVIKRNAASTANVTITGSPTLDGAGTYILSMPNQSIQVFSDGSEWKSTSGGSSTSSTAWGLTGNIGTTASTSPIGTAANNNFIGTIDAKDFVMATTNLERIRIASGGNVGIGITSPARLLDINGATRMRDWLSFGSSDDIGRITWGSDRFYMNGFAGKKLSLGSNANVDQLMIDLNGRVGIATTSPLGTLHVYNTSAYNGNENDDAVSSLVLYGSATGASGSHYGGITWASGGRKRAGISSVMENADADYVGLAFWTQGIDGPGSMFESMRISREGNVGIGTTAPLNKLHVNGGMRWGGTGVAPYTYSNVDANGLYMEQVGTSASNSKIRFQTSPSGSQASYAQFFVDPVNGFSFMSTAGGSSGSVGIGTASPGAALHVAGSNQALRLDYNNSTSYFGSLRWAGLQMGNNGDNRIVAGRTTAGGQLSFYVNNINDAADYGVTPDGTLAMRILSSGNIGVGVGSPSSFKVQVAGNVGPDADLTYDLGSASLRWNNLYVNSIVGPGALWTRSGTTLYNTNTSDNVGIGTSTPQKRLDVISAANDYITVGANTLSTGQWAGIHFGYRENNLNYRKSAMIFERTDGGGGGANAAGKIHFLNGPATGSGSATLADARLTIGETGNIGIGTTSPTYALDVMSAIGGSSRVYIHPTTGTDYALLQFSNNGGTSYFGMDNSGGTGLGSGAAYALTMYAANVPITLSTNAVERMRILSTGNIGIGTTVPAQKLEVQGNIKLDDNMMVEGIPGARVYRNLATYTSDVGGSAGLFIINTSQPFAPDCMFRVKIEGYFYDASATFETSIGAYSYSGASTFINKGYTNTGAKNLPVRLAKNASGNIAIILGTDGASYEYPKISVTSYIQGYGGINEAYADGWTITRAANTTGLSFVTSVPDVTAVPSGSGNYIQNQNASAQGANFYISGSGTLGSGAPLIFTSIGAGTYDKAVVYHDASNGFLLERARTTDASGGTITDFSVSQRGGGTPGLIVKGSGNVGINTAAPGTLLNVNLGAGDATVGTAAIRVGGTSNYPSLEMGIKGAYDGMISTYGNDLHIYAGNWRSAGATASENHNISFYTSQNGSTNWNTPKMFLQYNGNLGVGTTNPVSKLNVSGGDLQVETGQGRFKGWYTGGSGLGAEIGISAGQAYIYSYDRTASAYNPINLSGSTVGIGHSGNTVIFVNTSGLVGVGTTSPQNKLHIATSNSSAIDWNTIINNTNNSGTSGYGVGLRLQNSDIAGGGNEVHKWVGVAAIGSGGYSNQTDMVFYTNNFNSGANSTSAPQERMRITGSTNSGGGNVGIGTSSPNVLFDVIGAGTFGNGTYRNHVGWYYGAEPATVPATHGTGYAGGAANAWYRSTAFGFNNVSERKLKRNINPVEDNDALAAMVMNDIDKIKPSFYKYIIETDEAEPGNEMKFRPQMHLGVIVDEAPDYILDESFSGVDIYGIATLALAGVKQNREDIKEIKQSLGTGSTTTLNDFGLETMSKSELWIPFSTDFAAKNNGKAIPVVTVTAVGSEASLYIAEINAEGFRVINKSQGNSAVSVNWIAMLKVSSAELAKEGDSNDVLPSDLKDQLQIPEAIKSKQIDYYKNLQLTKDAPGVKK